MKLALTIITGLLIQLPGLNAQTHIEYDNNENPVAAYWEMEDGQIKAEFYFTNGKVKESGYFLDNKRTGEWLLYNQSEVIVAKGYFKDGKRVGKWLFYDDGGELTHEVSYDDNQLVIHKE